MESSGRHGNRRSKRVDQIFDFAELSEFADTPIKYYSSGMAQRLAFSIATELVPNLDESYCFDHDTTLAILVAFAYNRRRQFKNAAARPAAHEDRPGARRS